MSKVRLGFVGVGGMGQAAHLRNYISIPECEVVAIAELRPKLAQKVAARYGVPKVYDGHKALLAAEQLDGIVAIQPFTLHASLVPELLEKRVPVITEKPLGDSVEHGREIMSAVRSTKTPLYLAYHKRCDPASVYARQTIDDWKQSGEVGKLRYIRITMPPGDWSAQGFSQNVGTDETYESPKVQYDKKYVGFVNYYIHQVNLMRYFLREDYRVIFADPSAVVLAVRSDSGITGTLEMAPYNTTLDWQEEALICFERGWVKVELPAPLAIDRPGRVTIFKDPGKGTVPQTIIPTLPHFHAMRQQAINFVKAVKGEPTPLCPAEDGMKDLEVAQQFVDLLAKA